MNIECVLDVWYIRMYIVNVISSVCVCAYLHVELLFGSKLFFSRMLDSLYGAFWCCSRIQL